MFNLFFASASLLLALSLAPALSATAATPEPDSSITLSELSWIDKKYFDKQRASIDELGRANFGTRVRGNEQDIALMQRIIDAELVGLFDTDTHRALGVVLGDIYVATQGWEWREYKDAQGRSHGVCLPKTQECVFPLSMFTRRLRVTTKLDVARIYQRGLDLMADAQPQLPYTAPKPKAPIEPKDRSKIVVPFM